MVNTIEHDDEQKTTPGNEQKEIGALKALWDLFSSMKTAIVLLLLLAAVSMGITFYTMRGRDATPYYHSVWYSLLLILIGINLTVCSINRFGMAWRRTYAPSIEVNPTQLKKAATSFSAKAAGTPEELAEKAAAVLRKCAYVVTKGTKDGAVMLHASKGRFSIWGPYLTHLSLLVIFLGAIYGGLVGYEGYITIHEGERTNQYQLTKTDKLANLNFDLGLDSFNMPYETKIEIDPRTKQEFITHALTSYQSNVKVYEGSDKPVFEKSIEMNRPLSYKGISFFQTSYGIDSVELKITAPNGESAETSFPIITEQGQRFDFARNETGLAILKPEMGGSTLWILGTDFIPDYIPENGEHQFISGAPVNPAISLRVTQPESDPSMAHGSWELSELLQIGQDFKYKGFTITFTGVRKNTVLSVSRNPGLPIIYFGFGLLLLGVFTAFYLSHKVLRVHIAPAGKQAIVVAGVISRADPAIFVKDMARLKDAISPDESTPKS